MGVTLLLVGIPYVEYFGVEGEYNVMALQLLGPSLEDLFCSIKRKFSLQTVLLLFEQMLLRLEYLHSKNYIYRDIKPDNFCTGKEDPKTLYLIDYGLAIKFKNTTTGEHIHFGRQKNLTGTARYASLNAHLGFDQSRRDDLEGLGYVISYFLKGQLPWQGLPGNNKKEKYDKITELKQKCTAVELFSGYPEEFAIYMEYVKKLKFDEKPDYNYLRRMFKELFFKLNLKQIFDWEGVTSLQNPKLFNKLPDTGSKNNNTVKLRISSFAKRPTKELVIIGPQENGKEKKSSNDQGGKLVESDVATKQSTHKDVRMYMPACNQRLKDFVLQKHVKVEEDVDVPDEIGHMTPIITDYIQESRVGSCAYVAP